MRYDIVLWGATGFTGELVAAYLLKVRGTQGWALAGRSVQKLAEVRARLAELDPAATSLPLLVADAGDPASLRTLTAQAKVICTTVGPYAKYGAPLVAACVDTGTHCCDLTGESHFMKQMIDTHHEAARAKGVRIVHACGFDSVPSDLGVFVAQQEAERRFGKPLPRVRLYVRKASGGVSGGTIASMKNMLEVAAVDKSVRRTLADPYCLLPTDAPRGPWVRDIGGASWDADEQVWVGPFVMAATNAPVVRRSHALRGSPNGAAFAYTEVTRMGAGVGAWAKGQGMALGLGGFVGAMSTPGLKKLVDRFLPQPGEGPSRDTREKGFFVIDVVARGEAGQEVRVTVRGDKDPGYGATAGMLGEAALCLAEDPYDGPGGVLTPSVALGERYVGRLVRAGVTFSVA